MSELWGEYAVATISGPDGYRMIVGEGRLDSIVDMVAEQGLSIRDVRISLANRRHVPTSFSDASLAELLRKRQIARGERVRV